MNKVSTWLWGLVLVVVGVIWGINATGVAEINIFFPGWWTLFIIVPCFIGLFEKGGNKTCDIAGLVVGGCLLLGCLGLLRLDLVWALIVPVILVAIGLSMMFQGMLKGKIAKQVRERSRQAEGEMKQYWATFSGLNLQFKDKEFHGARLEAVFGGIKCDLSGAKITEDIIVNVGSVFGGVTLIVPDDVKVEVVSTNIFGGVEDKRKYKAAEASESESGEKEGKAKRQKTIFVEATCLFGGLEIR